LGGKPSSLQALAFHKYEAAGNIYNSFPITNIADGTTPESQLPAVFQFVEIAPVQVNVPIPGIDGKNVVQATDIMKGKAKVGQEVVVIGGRLIGMEIADLLAREGKEFN